MRLIENGLPAELIVKVTVKLRAVLGSVLVRAMVWFGGLAPACVVTLMAPGLTFSNGELLTYRVTGTISGLFPAPADVILTFPVQVPAASPVVLTDTAMVPLALVVPLAGAADRKLAQAVLLLVLAVETV